MKYLGTDPRAVTEFDDDKLQSNVALLGFKTAVNGSLAKYNLVDQIVDEYTDATGVDASASTNENLVAGVYSGGASSTPTRTQDADATGTDGLYTWFKWTDTGATGSYSANANETAEWLVVAGGGGGGADSFGGGVGGSRGVGGAGAGGLRTSYGSTSGGGASAESDLSLVSGTTYTVTVGAGGAGGASGGGALGAVGNVSSITGSDITDITTVGGGQGSFDGSVTGTLGGSGGGGSNGTAAGAGTANQGYAGGGSDTPSAPQGSGGGGGGASAVGATGTVSDYADGGGAGGAGLSVSITGSAVVYAGGGGGGRNSTGGANGGTGGGGNGGDGSNGGAGTANTGGGGGGTGGTTSEGSFAGGAGGSGIVILRVLTSTSVVGNLTLQSNDTTASTANPDYADMIVLMEDAEGTATLNTDIKGYISEDSGVTFTQGTLVDEGSWGTDKKIIAFHDLDISAQTGSAMCYKITTHNQSAGSKETNIHATSIGWK